MGARHGVRGRWLVAGALALVVACGAVPAVVLSGWAPVDWGASAIVHPFRRPVTREPGIPFERVRFESGGEQLEGWLFRATAPRATVVYLHGIGDNRGSGIGVAQRLVPRGYTVLAFDARGHGGSTGTLCSYGYHERHDLGRALDAIGASSPPRWAASTGSAC